MKKMISLLLLLAIAANMCACSNLTKGNNIEEQTKNEEPTPEPTPKPVLKKLYELFNEELNKAVEEGRAIKEGNIYYRDGIKDYNKYSEDLLNNDISLLERMLRNDMYLHKLDDYYQQYVKISYEKEELIKLEQEFDFLINRKIYEVRGKDNEKFYDAAEKFTNEIDNYMLQLTEYAQFGNDYLNGLIMSELNLKVYVEKIAKEAVELFLKKGAYITELESTY